MSTVTDTYGVTAGTGKMQPGMVTVTPRNIRFVKALPEAATWLGGDVVGTAVFNALSLTFPDGERMFMDSVRNFKHLLDGKLLEDANAFIAQEAIHTREHVSLNKVMDEAHYPLAQIRAHIKDQVELATSLGTVPMLGGTISLEHFTAMLGDYILRNEELMAGAPEDVRELWQWHALEETEHKAVAFDVFNVATKDWTKWRRYRVRAHMMALTTLDFISHITLYASLLLQADGMPKGKATRRVLWYLFGRPGFFRRGMRGYWNWYKPGFHPWQHDNSALLAIWRGKFAGRAAGTAG